MQRRGVASLRVSAVDVFWGTQLLNPGQAALLCRIQQGSVAPQQVLDVRVSFFDHVQRYVAITVFLGGVGAVLNNQVLCETPVAVVFTDQRWNTDNKYKSNEYSPSAAVYRSHICLWLQPHEAA